MTALQWYQSRQGQSLLVPGADPSDRGQCAQAADYALKEIYGLPYVWANAIDWWGLPQSLNGNFVRVTDGSIKAGDFVIYNQKIGSIYGHVDVALQDGNVNNFVAADSNWAGNLTLRQISHVGQAGYIIGALRPKGNNMATGLTNGDVDNLLKDFGITPTQADYAAAQNMSNKDFVYYLQNRLKHVLVDGDVNNLIRDAGAEPIEADYQAVRNDNPKDFVYYLQNRLKQILTTKGFTKVGNIDGVGDIYKKG